MVSPKKRVGNTQPRIDSPKSGHQTPTKVASPVQGGTGALTPRAILQKTAH